MLRKLLGFIIGVAAFAATWAIIPFITAATLLISLISPLLAVSVWFLFGATAANSFASKLIGFFTGNENYEVKFFSSSVGKGLGVAAAFTIFSPIITVLAGTALTAVFAAAAAKVVYKNVAGMNADSNAPSNTGGPVTQETSGQSTAGPVAKDNMAAYMGAHQAAIKELNQTWFSWAASFLPTFRRQTTMPAVEASGLQQDPDNQSKASITHSSPSL